MQKKTDIPQFLYIARTTLVILVFIMYFYLTLSDIDKENEF